MVEPKSSRPRQLGEYLRPIRQRFDGGIRGFEFSEFT